ncbi:outer membrane beta-barrel protein [Telluribacter humicola]|uniref:outer membrane beta-barrel protein n=1 Tax=Telluribacter humicola TaxID=1720261 RepID=UPI001A96ADFA|nr:outer membrane beta-barrel protein [Telluribacter humicola]
MLSLRHWPVLFLFFTSFTSSLFNSVWAQSKLSIAPTVAPFSSYSDSQKQNYLLFKYGTGLTIGANINYHFTPVWSLTTGYWYQWGKVKGQYGDFFNFFRSQEEYMNIPLLLNMRPSSRKVSPYFSGGVILSKETGLYKSRMAAKTMLGAGVSYQLSPRLTVIAQPTLVLGSDRHEKEEYPSFPAKRQLSFQAQLSYHLFPVKSKL